MNIMGIIVINIFGELIQERNLIMLKNMDDNCMDMNLSGIKYQKHRKAAVETYKAEKASFECFNKGSFLKFICE